MAIIRNDRSARRALEPQREVEPEPEEEIDYSWHPNEEEFVSPLSADQWAELLGDPSFADTDAARAVRCLLEYGEPATFQQLSIRYRGTMGRYRRWLSEAAQAAGERFGVSAPQQDQFGMDEWWPLLYCVRNTGKPGAGIQEMLLRPEVVDAFDVIAEQERQAKRAENARNLKRIEQLERARQEERERKAAEAAKEAERRAAEKAARETEALAAAAEESTAAAKDAQDELLGESPSMASAGASSPAEKDSTLVWSIDAAQEPGEETEFVLGDVSEEDEPVIDEAPLPTLRAHLAQAMDHGEPEPLAPAGDAADMAAAIDYALRYAERLRHAITLMQEGAPRLTVASLARSMRDESVELLQNVLNGQVIPAFEYVDRLQERLFVNAIRLEAREGQEDLFPVFCTLDEARGVEGAAFALHDESPCEIVYVVCDKRKRDVLVVVRFDAVRRVLLTRVPISLDDDLAVMQELDSFVRELGIRHSTRTVDDKVWDALRQGALWAGTALK